MFFLINFFSVFSNSFALFELSIFLILWYSKIFKFSWALANTQFSRCDYFINFVYVGQDVKLGPLSLNGPKIWTKSNYSDLQKFNINYYILNNLHKSSE